jgi:ribosomal protein L11 methyltransferase
VLRVLIPDALDDEIAAVLGGGSLGVEVAAAGPGRTELRVYLGPEQDAVEWRERAAGVIAAHGLPVMASALTVDPVEDERWVERWQATLSPIPLGSRFVVLATDSASGDSGREPIRLIPGMAFGTGEHETTRLCAAAVEEHVASGSRWLDLGTGTGVLSIIAARCGASRVLAIDIDPECVAVASEVLTANAAGDSVEVRVGSIAERGEETFDGLVANIQSSFFLAHAGRIAAALNRGGVLIASGFLTDDVDEIETALSAASFRVASRRSEGAWACLVLRVER